MKTTSFSFVSLVLVALCALSLTLAPSCYSAKKSPKPKKTTPRRTQPTTEDGSVTTEPTSPPVVPEEILVETGAGINYIKSNKLMPILEMANAANKPVFVEFFASWCGPCKTLDKEVLSTKEVYSFVNENFVSVKINADSPDGKAVSQLYDVAALPTMLFLDKKGNELGRLVGMTTSGRFIRAGADALGK
jgi:thiol-disulfide isomerase/thioredoxin